MNEIGKNLLLWLIVAAVLMAVFANLSAKSQPNELGYSEFLAAVHEKQITEVTFEGAVIRGQRASGGAR